MSKYDYDTSDYVMQMISEYQMKELMPGEWFGQGEKYLFEDLEVIGVSNANAYLKQLYGNYNKLPPEKERIGKHNVEVINE